MSLLEVNDINVYYGAIHAIKGISFSVDEGEVVTLIGANGAGKSTTLNTVAGLLRPREGSIHFGGKDLARIHASDMVKHGMALCPEGRRIFQQMTVLENLEMAGFTRPDKEIPAALSRCSSCSRQPEGAPEADCRPRSPAAEQQMLAMARALMSKPSLLMLDGARQWALRRFWSSRFSTLSARCTRAARRFCWWSRTRKALSVANRAYVLETGKISMSGDAQELLHNDAVRKAYLGA